MTVSKQGRELALESFPLLRRSQPCFVTGLDLTSIRKKFAHSALSFCRNNTEMTFTFSVKIFITTPGIGISSRGSTKVKDK